jgi:hypothetical protein
MLNNPKTMHPAIGCHAHFCNHKIWMQTICVEHIEQIAKEKYHTQCLITIANHSSLHK